MLVDSSVWIDFFHKRDTIQTRYFRTVMTKRQIVSADLVIVEVLQGVRGQRQFDLTRNLLTKLETVIVSDPSVAVEAARNYRLLRARGITIRKTIDTLIATRCIVDRIPLLYSDRDYDPFVEHLGLVSALNLPEVT